jgi:predicted phosphodiesterase
VLNPGSPTDKRRNLHYSFGMIELRDRLTAHIIYFGTDGRLIAVR